MGDHIEAPIEYHGRILTFTYWGPSHLGFTRRIIKVPGMDSKQTLYGVTLFNLELIIRLPGRWMNWLEERQRK